jgi:hypothetical protein
VDTEITQLEHPIDAMPWIHRALQKEGALIEDPVRCYQIDDCLQPIRSGFNFWASALLCMPTKRTNT